MQEISSNNKRIAKNTIYLYFRMLIVMCANLYIVRALLEILGAEDYGIYNVVGGIIGMMTFINGTLSTSSQRFFSISLTKNNLKELKDIFCANISVFLLIGFIILIIAETIGLWFVNTKLNIPENRQFAVNIVYQLTMLSAFFHLLKTPYDALIIAHEKMGVFAVVSLLEIVLKLMSIFALKYVQFDKLIMYGILVFIVSFIILYIYKRFCNVNFEESHFCYRTDRQLLKKIFSFSGWHFLGTLSVTIRGNGINILINTFFNPAVNAARAVAFQISSAVMQLSTNFTVAVKPQIYKKYSNHDYDGLFKLINFSSIISYFLISIIVIPIIVNVSSILDVWLIDVPEYTSIFVQLVLVNSFFEAANVPAIAAALATENIKKFELVTSILMCMNLPISYLFLRLGYPPYSTMFISAIISLITIFVRAFMLNKMIKLPFFRYCILSLKIIVVFFLSLIFLYTISNILENEVVRLLISFMLNFIFISLFFYELVLNEENRIYIKNVIKSKYQKMLC